MRVDGSEVCQGGHHISIDRNGGVGLGRNEEYLVGAIQVALDGNVLCAHDVCGDDLVSKQIGTSAVGSAIQ